VNRSELFATALDVQEFCREQGWDFCFIGGLAVQRWGVQRYTKDADLTLMTRYAQDEEYAAKLLTRFKPRRADALEFAQRARALFLTHENGVEIDVALGALPFEERCVARSSAWDTGDAGAGLVTCSAEDLVVHKAFAARDHDWVDVDGILEMRGDKLDLALIRRELAPFAEHQTKEDVIAHLERLFRRHKLV